MEVYDIDSTSKPATIGTESLQFNERKMFSAVSRRRPKWFQELMAHENRNMIEAEIVSALGFSKYRGEISEA